MSQSDSWNVFENNRNYDDHRFNNEHGRRPSRFVQAAEYGVSTLYHALMPRSIKDSDRKVWRDAEERAHRRSDRLVGVEENPGPPKVLKRAIKSAKKELKKENKAFRTGRTMRMKRALPRVVRNQVRTAQESRARSYIMPPVRSIAAGAKYNTFKTTRTKIGGMQSMRVAGKCIFLTNVVAPAATPGTLVLQVSLNPTTMGITRLSAMAPFFQRFWCNRMKFTLITGLPQNELGAVCAFWNSDPLDQMVNLAQAQRLNSASQRPGYKTYNVWHENMSWDLPIIIKKPMLNGKTLNELFYTDSFNQGISPQLVSQGSFCILVQNTLGTNALASLGNIVCEYEYEMYMGQDDFPTPPSSIPSLFQFTATGDDVHPFTTPTYIINSSPLILTVGFTNSISGFPEGATRWKFVWNLQGTGLVDATDWAITGATGTTVAISSKERGHNTAATSQTGYMLLTVGWQPGINNQNRLAFVVTGATTVTSGTYALIAWPSGATVDERKQSKAINNFWVGHPNYPEFSREKVRESRWAAQINEKNDKVNFERSMAALRERDNYRYQTEPDFKYSYCQRGAELRSAPLARRSHLVRHSREESDNLVCAYCEKRVSFDDEKHECTCLRVPEEQSDGSFDDCEDDEKVQYRRERVRIGALAREFLKEMDDQPFILSKKREKEEKENKKEDVHAHSTGTKNPG